MEIKTSRQIKAKLDGLIDTVYENQYRTEKMDEELFDFQEEEWIKKNVFENIVLELLFEVDNPERITKILFGIRKELQRGVK